MLGCRRVFLTLALGLLATCFVSAEIAASNAIDAAAAVPGGEESAEESLGSHLLSAVLADDLEAASTVFAAAEPEQASRLANAIDWRGKSVLMHAASRNFDGAMPPLRVPAAARRGMAPNPARLS
eukprot:scaffold22753_cov108-Isochrysis_galbana.AAC.2